MAETVVSPDPDVIRALRALSNPMRLQLLSWLRDPERHFSLEGAIADPIEVGVCVSHIQAKVGLAQSTVSAYMAELQRAGLVRATRVGKWTHYKRDEQRIAQLVAVLGHTLQVVAASREGARRLSGLALETPNPKPGTPIHRILAAYGPKMLELARDRSAGAHTYHVTVAHTARAREVLGPDAFLGVEHAVLFESDPEKARAIAREHLHVYLTTTYNIAKFRRLGYSEEEIANGGSDRIVDDLVFWGDLDTIVEKLHAHVAAGDDHVGVQVIGIEPGQSAMPYWRMLGDALLPQGVSA